MQDDFLFEKIADPFIQQFILDHEDTDEKALLLKHKDILGVPTPIIVNQIVGRRKSKRKLPAFYNNAGVFFPPSIHVEQCSSEATAQYKAEIIQKTGCKNLLCADLTGGMGVDSFYFSKVFKTVHYVETNEQLLNITKHNHKSLGVGNIIYHHNSAELFLENNKENFDLIFIDPSRRDSHKKKIFKLADCTPDITLIIHELMKQSTQVLIKASPLLDIQHALKELKIVSQVFVLAVQNECKELLFLCENINSTDKIKIEAVNFSGTKKEIFSWSLEDESTSNVSHSDPLVYLYEPNAALLKAGAFKLTAARFGLLKLHPNTHLYTSDKLMIDFPGRIFKINHIIKPDPKLITTLVPSGQANVFVRNYPLSVVELKSKIKIKDGGDDFIIGCTSQSGKKLILASQVF